MLFLFVFTKCINKPLIFCEFKISRESTAYNKKKDDTHTNVPMVTVATTTYLFMFHLICFLTCCFYRVKNICILFFLNNYFYLSKG